MNHRPADPIRPTRRLVAPLLLALALAATLTSVSLAGGLDHSTFDAVLKKWVDEKGMVDYKGLLAERDGLDGYVALVATATAEQVASWSREDQMAYFINAYNAITLKRIIDHYPPKGWGILGPKVSIKNIKGVWDRITNSVGGEEMTLDDIEHKTLRAKFADPRIHFALVCASKGCPRLSRDAYKGETLDAQLDSAADAFMRDPEKVRVATSEMRIVISPIFDWYAADFEPALKDAPEVKNNPSVSPKLKGAVAFIGRHLDVKVQDYVLRGDYKLTVDGYDWSLNDR